MSRLKILKTNLETIYLEMPRLSHSMVSIDQLASLDVVRPIDVMGVLNTSRLGLADAKTKPAEKSAGFVLLKEI